MSYMFETLGGIIIVGLIVVLVVLLIRELVCWYFKINSMYQSLEIISKETKEMRNEVNQLDSHMSYSLHEMSSLLGKVVQISEEQLAVMKKIESTTLIPEPSRPIVPPPPSTPGPSASNSVQRMDTPEDDKPIADYEGIPRIEGEKDKEYMQRVISILNSKIKIEL